MIRKELKLNAQKLLHRKYGSWVILTIVPIVITFFLSIILWTNVYSMNHTRKIEKGVDATTEYKSWRDEGATESSDSGGGSSTGGDYDSGYDDGYNDGYDKGYDYGYDYGYDDGVYDSYYYGDDSYGDDYDWDDNRSGSGVDLSTISVKKSNIDTSAILSITTAPSDAFLRGIVKTILRLIFIVFLFILSIVFFFYKGIAQWAAVDTLSNKTLNFQQLVKGFFSNQKGVLAANSLVFLYSFLWGLLFIIPGIWKASTYSMMNYLLRKEDLNGKEAMKLSQEMMNGYKLEYFILKCSFIPHYVLCLVTFGAACLYVHPYIRTTEALFFEQVLKENRSSLPYKE